MGALAERRWHETFRAGQFFAGAFVMAFVLSELGYRLLRDPHAHSSVWWPLSGFAVALVVRLRRRRDWPSVMAGLSVGQYLSAVTTYYAPLEGLVLIAGVVVETSLICWFLQRWFPQGIVLNTLRRVVVFALVGVAGVVVGATIIAVGRQPWSDSTLQQMWTGYFRTHCLGLLMVCPLFLLSSGPADLRRELSLRWVNLEWAAQFTAVGVVTWGILPNETGIESAFVCVLPLIWGAQRLGPVRALASHVLMAMILTIATLHGAGPLVEASPTAQTIGIQVLLASSATAVLFIGVSAAEKNDLLVQTQQQRRDLSEAERITEAGSAAWDLATGELRWSEGLYRLLGVDRAIAPSLDAYVAAIHPEDRDMITGTVARLRTGGRSTPLEYRVVHPDGAVRFVLGLTEAEPGPDGEVRWLRTTVRDVTNVRQAEQALLKAHNDLAVVMAAVTDVAIVGASAKNQLITFFNRGAEKILGWRAEEVVGKKTPMIYHLDAEKAAAAAKTGIDDPMDAMVSQMDVHTPDSHRWTCVRKDGGLFQAQLSVTPYPGPDGEIEGYIGTLVDLTKTLQAEAQLQESEDRFYLAFDHAPTAMCIVTLDPQAPAHILRANAALCTLARLPESDIVGEQFSDIMAVSDKALTPFLSGEVDAADVERSFRRQDGSQVWGRLTTSTVRPADGSTPYLILMLQDITASRQLNEKLEYEATHDHLTGLVNGADLRRRLHDVFHDQKDRQVALLFIDLDGFKGVNDTSGHAAGDELLIQVADRISTCVRSGDVVARIGGDEFAVLCPGIRDPETVRLVGERIVTALQTEFQLGTVSCRIGGSVGIALAASGDTAQQLLEAADAAMYSAKRHGKGQVRFSQRET